MLVNGSIELGYFDFFNLNIFCLQHIMIDIYFFDQ